MNEAIQLHNQATKIQSVWRGQKDRREIQQKLLNQQGQGKDQKQLSVHSNEFVMQSLKEAANKIGLSPEMLFRAADKNQTNTILVEEFKLFLSKLKLGLSKAQISRIVFLCDEDCSGVIRKEEYYNCLQAYEVNEEVNKQATRTFGQQCLVKYGKFLINKQMNPDDSYSRIDQQFKGFITLKNLSEFISSITTQEDTLVLNEKEVAALFHFMDQEKYSKIMKDIYLQKVHQGFKVAAQEVGVQLSKALNPKQQDKKKPGGTVVSGQKDDIGLEQNIDTGKIMVPKVSPQFIKELQAKQFDFEQFTDNLIQIMGGNGQGKIKNGAVILDVFKACQKQQNIKMNRNEQMMLFRIINTDGNGLVDYDEIGVFYLRFKDKKPDFKLVYELLGLKLKARNQDLLSYILQQNQNDSQIKSLRENFEKALDKSVFYNMAGSLFWVENNNTKNELFQDIKDEQDGNVYLHCIEKKIKQSDRIQNKSAKTQTNLQEIDEVNKKSTLQNAEVDLNEYEIILNKMKPVIDSDDLFNKKKIEDNKSQKFKIEWATIFNNEKACLKYAYEQVKLMEKSGQNKWIDPEFGPNQFDQYGASSLYTSDNDIPPGCPTPEEVQWLHPEQIIKILVDQGEDQYEGCEIDFITEGAESNDVKQSKYLGDCYFISALSLIAADDTYLRGSFDPNTEIQSITKQQIKGMMSGIWPPMFQFLAKYGIYVIRFFKNYKWRYVMIDDRIPCKENAEIIYAQCAQANELWVSLIEKAYAKIHNSYQSLISGDIAQALADLTGLVADKTKLEAEKYYVDKQQISKKVEEESQEELQNIEEVNVREEMLKTKINNQYEVQKKQIRPSVEELWNTLVQSKETGTMMGCSADGETEGFIFIDGESSGIMSGHAYSIIDVFTLDYNTTELQKIKRGQMQENYHKNHRMLRIRNPWGFGEWQFKWSEQEDGGKLDDHFEAIGQYYDKEIERFKNVLKREPPEKYRKGNDGTFLMCFSDWRKIFTNLFQCINFPDDYKGYRFKEQWQEGNNFGVPKKSEDSKRSFALGNPQYVVNVNRTLDVKTKLYISLGQREGRLFAGEKYPFERVINSVLVCVFKLDKGEEYLTKFDKNKMIASSEKLNLRREVDTGEFQVGNGSYAIIPCTKNNGDSGKFTLNIYHNLEKQQGITFTKIVGEEHQKDITTINEKSKEFWIMEEEEDDDSVEVSKELLQLMIQNIKQ